MTQRDLSNDLSETVRDQLGVPRAGGGGRPFLFQSPE